MMSGSCCWIWLNEVSISGSEGEETHWADRCSPFAPQAAGYHHDVQAPPCRTLCWWSYTNTHLHFTLTPFSIIIVLCRVGRCEGMTVTHSLVLAKVSLALTSWLLREDTLPRFFSRRAAFSFAKSDILLRNID